MELIERFVHCGPDGQERATLSLGRLWGSVYRLHWTAPATCSAEVEESVWATLIESGLRSARDRSASEIQLRLSDDDQWGGLAGALQANGFSKKHVRVEFQTPIDALPSDHGTPFVWRLIDTLEDADLDRAAALLQRASEGDPDCDSGEDFRETIRGYLCDSALTASPRCIQIGTIGNEPTAIVVAQVKPSTGWSRITYMGVLPGFRGKGLGSWVQRRGFQMMRQQGGSLYHGGTTSTNAPMLRLFRQHRCKEYRRLQEWAYRH